MTRHGQAFRALLACGAVVLTATTGLNLAAGAHAGGNLPGGGASSGGSAAERIAFRRYLNAAQTRGAIFVVNTDGTGVRRVSHAPAGWRDNVPAWSPDGRLVAFERFKNDTTSSRIMLVDPDTGDTRALVPCTGDRCIYANDPYFAPDGRTVAYARTVAPPNTPHPDESQLYAAIFVIGVDGSGDHQVTATPRLHPGQLAEFEASDPTFAPDGRTLAFLRVRHEPEENTAVFVQPLGSPGAARRITPWKMNCQDRPTFSPDGADLLFRCQPKGEDGPSNLYLVHPDGSRLHQITFAPSDRQFLGTSFSPGYRRGTGWIAAGRSGGYGDDGNADVFLLRMEGGKLVRMVNLTRSEPWDSAPGWGAAAG